MKIFTDSSMAGQRPGGGGGGGEDFGGGRQLLLDFKRCGNAADHPTRCHVMLIHETAMSITESGVMVSM